MGQMVGVPLLGEDVGGREAVGRVGGIQGGHDAVEGLADQAEAVQLVPHGDAVLVRAGRGGDSRREAVDRLRRGDEHVAVADGDGEGVPGRVVEGRGRAGEAGVLGEGDGFTGYCVGGVLLARDRCRGSEKRAG